MQEWRQRQRGQRLRQQSRDGSGGGCRAEGSAGLFTPLPALAPPFHSSWPLRPAEAGAEGGTRENGRGGGVVKQEKRRKEGGRARGPHPPFPPPFPFSSVFLCPTAQARVTFVSALPCTTCIPSKKRVPSHIGGVLVGDVVQPGVPLGRHGGRVLPGASGRAGARDQRVCWKRFTAIRTQRQEGREGGTRPSEEGGERALGQWAAPCTALFCSASAAGRSRHG